MSRIPAPDAETAEPPSLPGYRFIEHVGAGGNAQVYLYEQNLPRRKVAVKVLNDSALSEAARRRFITEANVTAGLAHRHIVQVFDAKVTDDGRPYIVMPYYPQPNLSVRARRAHFSVADVLRIGIQIGSAVETSHRRGVLHRDIKPQNILTDSYGEPALTDFGIATTKGGDGPEGLSVPWSPPEILFGTSPGDQRADVYSLGATLWHLLVGRSPFEVPGDNGTLALMRRIKSDPPPRTLRADVPDSLERLLRQALAKDPGARPQSAMELIRGLQSVEQELRLPLTQPTLATDEPPGNTQGSDTVSISRPPLQPRPPRAASAAWGNTSQSAWGDTGQPAGDTAASDRTIARPGRPAAPWPAPGRPADDNDKATVKRGPIRIDPRGPAAGPAGQAALDAWVSRPVTGPERVRQFPREAPETVTVARRDTGPAPVAAGPPQVARPGRQGSVVALAGGAAALAVLVGVALFVLPHGGGPPGSAPASSPPSTQTGGANDPFGLDAGPGTPVITPVRLSATRVKFTWTYANAASTDESQWSVTGTVPRATGHATKPELVVSVPGGGVACLEVRVTSAEGAESAESQQTCWP